MAVLDAQRFTSDSLTSDGLLTGHEGDVMSKLRAMINRSQRLLTVYRSEAWTSVVRVVGLY